MDDLTINHMSARSSEARLSVHLSKGFVALLLWLAVALAALGILLLIGEHAAIGWVLMALAVVPYALRCYYLYHLKELPIGKGSDVTSLLAGDILGRLPARPTPADIATVVGQSRGGQFMGVRLGLMPSLLSSMIATDGLTTAKLLKSADDIRQKNGLQQITGAVLVAAIVRSFPRYEAVIAQIHLDDDDLDRGIMWQQQLVDMVAHYQKPRRTGGLARDWSFGWIPLLERFGQNISEQIGRSGGPGIDAPSHTEAVKQLVDTFGQGGRQNAALVGQSGSGKTTIIHAFAERLLDATENIPDSLKFRQIIILDSSALISAAPGRGELESLVIQIFNEAYAAKNVIICLDNAQLFFEEGVGAVDLTNVLQPILEGGGLRMILSMDEQRFLEIGRKNPALTNALNRIVVPPTNEAETKQIMQEQLVTIEFQRHSTYMYQAIKEAYRLSERYVHDLAMPGRAIKLLDSASGYSESGLVTMNSVQQAIEKTMDVKVSVASDAEDRDRLLHMEDLIHKRMVDQTRAVSVVSDALRRARAGVRNQDRPIGTFLFLGPTGVGKTELSKALADVYFGGEGKLVRIDLNEFVRPEDVSRLIADGADDPLSLTAQVMKQPFSVVLLDEIEKAAPEVLTTLLQLLDEGILRDIKNREISFRDAIVIATSNAGSDRIREYVARGYQVEQFEKQFTDELINAGQFRPEFLNRFDEIVVFRPFTREELLQVCDLILAGVNKTLASQKVSVVVEDKAKLVLVEKGYDPRLGARPMRRVVQKAVENTVAKAVLSGNVNPGDVITITYDQVVQVFAADAPEEPVPVDESPQPPSTPAPSA